MNGEHMVAGSEENKRQAFTINNVQGQELLMTKFEHGTWFLGILHVIKVAGMIAESGMSVMGCNRVTWLSPGKPMGVSNFLIIFTGVMSECTALLSWKSGFGGVLDSSFSSCTVPTYYCRSKYFLVSIHKFGT